MGLLVGHHLQPVLDETQEAVGGVEIVAHALRRSSRPRQAPPASAASADAQLGMAAAGDELLGLHEELDLADAAAAELDVVALDRDLVVAAIGVDLALHGVDVGDRGEVEIFAPDEGRERGEQRFAGRDVAGARPRLDQRGALPVLADALVVVERRRGRDRDLGRGRIGAQPQIDAEHVAVGGALLQELHQRAREAHVERRRLGSRQTSAAGS